MAEKQEKVEDFLVMKSTEQQLKEGVDRPVDTAYVQEKNGTLMLVAVFDIHHFTIDDVSIGIGDGKLTLTAQCEDDRDEAVYRKTMVRTLDLPEYADTSKIRYDVNNNGILTVEMPLVLPQKRSQPANPSVVPIINENGQRKIRLQLPIGSDFTIDDVKVTSNERDLTVAASYDAEVGVTGKQVTRHELKKTFRLPEYISVGNVDYQLKSDGVLHVEVLLNDDPSQPHYRCSVTTEDVTAAVCNSSLPSKSS